MYIDWHIEKHPKSPPKRFKEIAKEVPQKVPQKDPALRAGPNGESLDFLSFSKIIPPWGRVNAKKYFEITHRYQGVLHAKFGWNPSSLSSKSKQTNTQTDRQTGLFYV